MYNFATTSRRGSIAQFAILTVLFLVFSLLLMACGSAEEEAPAPAVTSLSPTETLAPPTATTVPTESASIAADTLRNVVYANVAGVETKLDVYLPGYVDEGPLPVVIVVPGIYQSRFSLISLVETIAEQGAIVYALDIDHKVPATSSIERIACAVRFARATAKGYGGDPGTITLVGNSMGANTGIIAALDGDAFEGDCVVAEGSALVDGFVGYEGVYDLATVKYNPAIDHSFLKDENPELWQTTDPYSYTGLRPELRIRLIHGVDAGSAWYDIPPEASEEFYQALLDAGHDVELMLVEDSPHGALVGSQWDAFEITVEQVMELTAE